MRGRKPQIATVGDVVTLPLSALRIPKCPDRLKGLERDCWDETARILVGKNIYDDDCSQVLLVYCVQYARFLTANERVQKQGLVNGRRYNPYVTMSNMAYDRMVRLAGELGLTPVSRKRVARSRGLSTQAPAAKYLKA